MKNSVYSSNLAFYKSLNNEHPRKDSNGSMKKYELTVLVHPDLESEIDKAIELISGIITKADGKIVKQDNWGKKRLAYSIDKQFFANYLYFELELPATAPLKISNVLNITKEVMRYLLVKADPKTQVKTEAIEEK